MKKSSSKQYVINEYLTGEDIKRLRSALGMTQKEFASLARCSTRTVENWETKGEKITGPIVPLFEVLIRRPEFVRNLEVPKKERGLRLWYMYENIVCTVIDVDEMNREVKIYNYIVNPLYRAFGINTEPTYEDYEEFIESRCFPRTRDKIKLELKKLDIPFYDPILIIEKTEGRMADDKFWIRLES